MLLVEEVVRAVAVFPGHTSMDELQAALAAQLHDVFPDADNRTSTTISSVRITYSSSFVLPVRSHPQFDVGTLFAAPRSIV
jgi:hypothetical protein